MSLFFSLLPVYLLGNLHCAGMCGPLVMLLAKHPHRYLYFFGRIASFSFAGMLCGEMGSIALFSVKCRHFSSCAILFFGMLLLLFSVCIFFKLGYPGQKWLAKRTAKLSMRLSQLMTQGKAVHTFLFGFFSLALPCGQTLVIFSACAMAQNAWSGMFNGFAFALLTSPSLIAALYSVRFVHRLKKYYNPIMGISVAIVGCLSLMRGLASLGVMNHCILSDKYHIVIF
jgi:sulfite exporter TauE/SafE